MEDKEKKEMKLETVNIGEVDIFEAGTWKGVNYTEKDIDEMVNNFQGGVAEPFVTIDHSDKASGQFKDALQALALGFVEKLERRGKKLYAWFKQVPKTVADLIEAGALKKKSIEFYRQFVANGKPYRNVLQGVTFHGANGLPEVNTLSDFLSLYKSNLQAMDNTQEGIESLQNSDLNKESNMDEVSLKRDEYSELQKTSLKFQAVVEDNESLRGSMETLKADVEATKKENIELKAKIAEQEKEVANTLKAEAEAFIDKKVNDGVIKPAHRDRYVSEYVRYKAEPETFKSFVEDIEGRNKVIDFKPVKDGKATDKIEKYDPEAIEFKAGQSVIDYNEIEDIIQARMKEKGISWEEAAIELDFFKKDDLGYRKEGE